MKKIIKKQSFVREKLGKLTLLMGEGGLVSFQVEKIVIKEYLKKLKFSIKNEQLTFGEYDKFNINILNDIINQEKSRNVFIHLGGNVLFILSIIVSAIVQYLKNMRDPNNHLLNFISEGDVIEIEGARAKFVGIEDDKIILQYSDLTSRLPLKFSYKLRKYNGNAKTLSKYPVKKSTRRNVTKNIISEIFDIDITTMSSIIKYSTLIVAPKNIIYEMVKNIRVSDDENSYEFTSLFPCAYYGSVERMDNFRGNAINSEPILKFTSKISTARDIIQVNKDIKNLIILGEDIYKNNLSDLEWILKRKSVDNVIIILDWSNVSSIQYMLGGEEKYNVFAWSEEALLSNINLSNYLDIRNTTSAYIIEQKKVINYFLNRNVDLLRVDDDEKISGTIRDIRKTLNELAKTNADSDDKNQFIKISYGLLSIFEKLPVPLKYLEKAIDEKKLVALHPRRALAELRILAGRLLEYTWTSNYKSKVDFILSKLEYIREQIQDFNPKWAEFIKEIRAIQYKSHLVLVPKAYYAEAIYVCFREKGLQHNIKILPVSKYTKDAFYDEILLVGVYDDKKFNAFNNCYAMNEKYLAYPIEAKHFLWARKMNDKLIKEIEKVNSLVKYEETAVTYEPDIVLDKETENEVNELVELESIIDSIIRSETIYEFEQERNVSRIKCIRCAVFETGERAYFTRYFKPNVIDRDSENIIEKNVEDLKPGDELVFVRNEHDMEKDIILDIIDRLMMNRDFKDKYDNILYLSRIWKEKLRDYLESTGFNEEYISRQLAAYNCSRDAATIATWIRSNKIIGPLEKNVYKALASITNDSFMIKNWVKIHEACSIIRKLHTRLKKYLASSIIKSVVGVNAEDSSEFRIIREIVGELSELAQIVQVESIFELEKEIPAYMANKLIEM